MMQPDETEAETLLRAGLDGLSERLTLNWLRLEMEYEADAQCGAAKGRHSGARTGRRHGYEAGSVVLNGRRVPVLRPRVRALDGRGELPLPSYQYAQDEAFLSKAMISEVLAGAAQRRYAPAMAAKGGQRQQEPPPGSVSRSTVSRRCQEQMGALLDEICRRPLGTESFVAVFVDGVEMGGHRIIVALGVTTAGEKQVLGLWPGATESEAVCRAALEDLGTRGLTAERGLLVVIDGGKGLAAAVRAVWGERALIQRCQAHKARNCQEKLPGDRAAPVLARVHRAWSQKDASRGERLLRDLAAELEREGRADAAASLHEGLAETLTCVRLGLPPELCTALETTNAIESVFSRHEDVSHRVKWWRNGAQAQRWLATSLALAEQSFGPLADAALLGTLVAALAAHVASLPGLQATA